MGIILFINAETEQGYNEIVKLAKHWNAIGDEISGAYVISDCARCAGFGVPRRLQCFSPCQERRGPARDGSGISSSWESGSFRVRPRRLSAG